MSVRKRLIAKSPVRGNRTQGSVERSPSNGRSYSAKIKILIFAFIALTFCHNIYAENKKLSAKVAPKNILFLAHFNNSVKPEIGNSEDMAYQAQITSGQKGMLFKNSAPSPECLDISYYKSFLAFPGANNIDINQGTLQFWVKPKWSRTGYRHCIFFKFHNNIDDRGGIEWRGRRAFFIQKPSGKDVFSLTQAQSAISVDVPYGSIWHQIATTWSSKRKIIKFYFNGKLIGTRKYLKAEMTPREIIFGVPDSHCARAYIDEVRILNMPLSGKEIKKDFIYQKAGNEFYTPNTQSSKNGLKFAPQMPAENKRESSNFENIELPVFYVSKAPILDANLSEGAWKKAKSLPAMLNKNGKKAKVQTTVKLLYDNKNIYIGAIMNEPSMSTLSAQFDQNDLAIYNDDCLEFVIKTPGNKDNFYHLAVNAIGSLYDARAGDKNFNTKDIKIKTRRLSDKWILEMAIPVNSLKTYSVQKGTCWGARFCRERHGGKTEYSSIPAAKTGSFSSDAFLGEMNFKGRVGKASVVIGEINAGKFLPGINNYNIKITNRSKSSISADLCTTYFDQDNNLCKTDVETTLLKKGSNNRKLALKVLSDRVKRISISLKTRTGENLLAFTLERGFITVSPGLDKLESELVYLENNMRQFENIKHPLYEDAVAALHTVKSSIEEYKEKLNQAVYKNNTVSIKTWNKLISVVNGFNKYRLNRRYLIWKTSPWENGSSEAIAPLNYKEHPSFTFKQAGNEQEVVCFVISGMLCSKRLDLRIVPHPVKLGKKFIPTSSFEVYTEPFLNHMGKKINSTLLKVPGNIVTVTPGNSQRIWLVFNSRGVPAGNYQTRLVIKPLNNYTIANRSIPVYLKVYNFSLPETKDWPLDCFFWRSLFGQLDEVTMLKMLHKFHIKWSMTESHKYTHGFTPDKRWLQNYGRKDFDHEKTKHANQEFFDAAKKLNMKIVFAWGTHSSVDWHQIMIKRLKNMGFGYKDFIFHGGLRDEFKAKDIPGQANFRKKMYAADSKAQFMATLLSTPPPSGATFEQMEKAGLFNFFKVWAIISVAKPELFKKIKEKKRNVWAYRCNLNMQKRNILDYYRFFAWQGYLNGLNGIAFWAFNDNKGIDGFDHRDGYDDGICLIDNDHQPHPSKQLHAVREGLEDVAYMDILKKSIERVKKLKPSKKISKYQKLLTKIPEKIMRDKSQEAIEKWRIKVANAIETLNKIQ